ncbi:EscU/YscU/HrcU family type III secretion system export apparatus switch protein [Salipiger mangrovisoli]|uniref:Flagellar biosynthesis protein FlhB n=1 Tax=Salipiger mangrovisoli TaxID=2865933 RepID=A0ABR9WX91_9RHOB|nr:flagellar type III secretion system protein FlhB [Salipiger mangrovisoli]MBE9635914.1 flagellar biosynthesis protein FlhB [Salipiger mangrovisoli]
MAAEEGSEKSHEPSQRKLDEARRKGDIARAPDLLTAAGYMGLLLVALAVGPGALQALGRVLVAPIDQPDRLVTLFFDDPSSAPVGGLMAAVVHAVWPWLLTPTLAVLLALLATRGLVFTPSKLMPKLERLSPLENARNKYGRRGLFEFSKSFGKLCLYSAVLGLFLSSRLEEIAASVTLDSGPAAQFLAGLMRDLLGLAVLVALALGMLDLIWQNAEHLSRNRMSQKELRDEQKEAEGDPMFKQQRRLRAQEIALSRMIADLPRADVVITNPTHYAVALRWDRTPGSAPICIAKGQDEMARRIREIAAEHGVPVHSDPATARALYATTEIGAQIAPEFYRPVAAAIRFSEEMRARARRGWRRGS